MLPASTFLRWPFLEELEKESSLDKELALDPQTSVLIINKMVQVKLIHTSQFFRQCEWEIKQDTEFFLDKNKCHKKTEENEKVVKGNC